MFFTNLFSSCFLYLVSSVQLCRFIDDNTNVIYRKDDSRVHIDGLHVLLSLNLARGFVAGIVKTLILLQGKGTRVHVCN